MAVKTVNSYSNSPTIPSVHITPIVTVKIEIIVALKDLKKRKKIKDVTTKAKIKNLPNSALIVWEYLVLTYGIPDILTSRLYFCSNSKTFGSRTSVMNFSLSTVFNISLFRLIAVRTAWVSELIINLY